MTTWMESWSTRVQELKTETYAIYLASRDPRVPWYARALIAAVVVHTVSPIDLIPDFIPVLGYLDVLVIAPPGIALALKMIPEDVLAEGREKAQETVGQQRPTSRAAASVIMTVWLIAGGLLAALLSRAFRS
jgi:uncharacterized membrane protein YkvA (DUF1232 family)